VRIVHRLLRLAARLLVAAALLAPKPATAESALELAAPQSFGRVGADTYDEQGQRVGSAAVRVEALPDGLVELEVRSGIDGAEHTVLNATLARIEGGDRYRPVFQSSRSFDASGKALGLLSVDHVRSEVTCDPPIGGGSETQKLALPPRDRVANVPLDLLFLPLARGETERVSFQFVLCRGGPRVYDAVAEVARVTDAGPGGGEHVVEVRYQIDFGPMLTSLVAPFLPTLSVWLDAARPDPWLGHRVPLFSKGPTVVVTRTGFNPTLLGVGR
jgi:hypothetical protein